LVVLSCFLFSSGYQKALRLGTWISKWPSLPPLREKTDEKTLNAYMPGLSDSMPVQNLLVLRSANFGRNLHAFFPTVANPWCFVQSGDRESTGPVEQDRVPRAPMNRSPQHTACWGPTPRHRLARHWPQPGQEFGVPIRFSACGVSMTYGLFRGYDPGFREWPDDWYGFCPVDLGPASSVGAGVPGSNAINKQGLVLHRRRSKRTVL